jgi:tetratricopeptide (TPR) repeat protein
VRTIGTAVVVCCWLFFVAAGPASPQESEHFESLLASAQQAQARGDFQSAAQFYAEAVKVRPEIAELRANLGLMYFQSGKDEQAIEAFREAIRLKPGLFVPNLFLGLDYVKLKRFSEAIPYLKQAALLNATDIQAQLALGQAYAGSGKTRPAIASYLRAVQLAPGNADGWFHLGVSYLDQVEADARLLLVRHKDSGYLQALMADTFAEQGAFIQAAEAYKKTLTFPAFPAGMHAGYGFVLLNQRDFAGAERELDAELASNPGFLMAKLGRARLHVEQGASAVGAKEIADIWRADAGFLRANAPMFNGGLRRSDRSELQRSLEQRQATGEIPEEVISLFQIDGTSEKSADLPQTSGVAAENPVRSTKSPAATAAKLYTSGRYGECADLLAAQLQLLQIKDLRLLVSCAYSTANYQPAAVAAQKLALNAATEAEGLYWETRSAQKLAAEALARASEIDSSSPRMHVLLGDIYRQRLYFPEAEQEYRKALALQPEDPGALFGLSLTLLVDSKMDETYGLAQVALKKNPDDPEFNAVMGEILCDRQDFSGAEPYLMKGLNTKPELIPHVHALLGRVYAGTNRTQQAIAELKLALSDDKDGRLHYQIGRLYLKVGDHASAQKAFEESHRIQKEASSRTVVPRQQGETDFDSQ